MKFTVKQARLMAGLTQKEAAEIFSVHVHTYMKWEKNPEEISIGTAKQLAKIFGRSVEEIFFEDESNLIRQGTS